MLSLVDSFAALSTFIDKNNSTWVQRDKTGHVLNVILSNFYSSVEAVYNFLFWKGYWKHLGMVRLSGASVRTQAAWSWHEWLNNTGMHHRQTKYIINCKGMIWTLLFNDMDTNYNLTMYPTSWCNVNLDEKEVISIRYSWLDPSENIYMYIL